MLIGNKKEDSLSPLILIISLASALFLFRLLIIDVMRVDGQSMEPTLHSHQVIFINRVSYGLLLPFLNRYILRWGSPAPGDVVVFPSPIRNRIMVKRCFAAEGDSINYLNGYLKLENIIKPIKAPQAFFLSDTATVPQGHILVLGDNLQNSIDSRNFGFVSIDKIIGKAILTNGRILEGDLGLVQ